VVYAIANRPRNPNTRGVDMQTFGVGIPAIGYGLSSHGFFHGIQQNHGIRWFNFPWVFPINLSIQNFDVWKTCFEKNRHMQANLIFYIEIVRVFGVYTLECKRPFLVNMLW